MKKMKNVALVSAIAVLLTACGTKGAQATEMQTDKPIETETVVADSLSEETVEETTSVVENTNVDDSTTETVVDTATETEVEPEPEDQVYADFDAWVAEILNDNSIKIHPDVLVWNAETNKHEIVNDIEGYQGLEEGDKVYVTTDDVKEIICNGEGIYDAEDDLFKTKYEGQLYIELENIKLDGKNNIRVRFYSEADVLYIWEVE